VINLAPADLQKNGSGYDVSIALGIIAASGQAVFQNLEQFLIMGELGLDGSVRDITGALPIADHARSIGMKACILPRNSAVEAAEIGDIAVYGVSTLSEVVRILENPEECRDLLINGSASSCCDCADSSNDHIDFKDIVGQEGAKRGIEIAAAGGHNVIMIGPPGSGKSSLAKAMASILPEMTHDESIVTSKIYSVAGKGNSRGGIIRTRPFRTPHHNASMSAMIGGGAGDNIIPGEISLAHCGVLFLDEFNQMPKSVVEALRGPLEDRKVVISRLKCKVEYPASFVFVAASNPCPCGYYGEGDRCICTPSQRISYLSKLSGPILDRIDIQLWLHPVQSDLILNHSKGESSRTVAERVRKARQIQTERFSLENINFNAEMNNRHIEKYCPLSSDCTKVLETIMDAMQLSMRSIYRIIKVARTIADLDDSNDIKAIHISEAAGFRFLDKISLGL